MSDQFDTVYRRGDAIVFILKHKPYLDLGLPPSSNEYRDATCVNIGIFDPTTQEALVKSDDMKRVPNRPGWYYYRYQTTRDMATGLYTVIMTAITKIDGENFSNRTVQQFRLLSDAL